MEMAKDQEGADGLEGVLGQLRRKKTILVKQGENERMEG